MTEEEPRSVEAPPRASRSRRDRIFHPGESLTQRVVHAGTWSVGLKIGLRVLATIKLIILARLLAPDQFGLMAVGIVVLALMETMTITGFEAALVQRQGDIRPYLNTAWTIELLRQVLVGLLLFLAAPLAAAFFNEPDAAPIIRWLGLAAAIVGFTNIGIVYFQKELEFQKDFVLRMASTLADVCVGIGAAIVLRNVWALVYGSIASSCVRVVVSYLIHPYRPRLEFDRRKARSLFSFGKWVFLSDVSIYFLLNIDYLVVGRYLGTTALGLYRMGFQISQTVATELTFALGRVMFPAYSMLQGDLTRLRRAFRRSVEAIAFAATPFSIGLAIVASDLTRVLLGPAWVGMAGALALLSIAGLLRSLASTTGALFRGMGRPSVVAYLSFTRLLVLGPIVYPMTMRWGLTGTAGAVLLSSIAVQGISLFWAFRATAIGGRDVFRMFAFPAVNTAVMAGAALAVQQMIPSDAYFTRLVGTIVVGAATYGVAVLVSARRFGYNAAGLVPKRVLRGPRGNEVLVADA